MSKNAGNIYPPPFGGSSQFLLFQGFRLLYFALRLRYE